MGLYTEQILEQMGWTIECESPFEIRHQDGSFATLQAAYIVAAELERQYKSEHKTEKKRKIPYKKKEKKYRLVVEGNEIDQVHLQDIIDPLGFSFFPIQIVEIRKNHILGFEKSVNKTHKLKSFFVLINGKMEHKTIKNYKLL